MGKGKAGGKNLTREKTWTGSKSTTADQSKVGRRPSHAGPTSSKKSMKLG